MRRAVTAAIGRLFSGNNPAAQSLAETRWSLVPRKRGPMTYSQILAFSIVAGMMGLFVWGRLRYDLVHPGVRFPDAHRPTPLIMLVWPLR